ncbi:50S ribosomal protein L21 [Aquisalinus flavus]|uniref:Large ribosomal subunit protein bL21 n=1 Tax=Aquisalinus flavus TaxID=1526572 RepID=A0A8J2V6H5_9PROT|nr:50S ribosomal protein L21 [Aquisalinus flavus]MBD0425794.1 50S ribosomal protein L21 [Aquisalinus flavus]UNE48600.1 50S ribosomal protein L21 [Aquisalinus flavus]GGD13222.1 50S ribosomal protein L21 [Aquisalinus flavus]
MYAVVKTGGKQYRVAQNDVIKVERLDGDAGDTITLEEVIMVGNGADVKVGAPKVDGASVAAEILEQARTKKITVFKKRRRQNYRRKAGHRQHLTVLRITDILTDGAKPAKKAAAKPAAKTAEPKAETAPKDIAETPAVATQAADFKDDISLIGGVGPKLKEKLEGYGITSLKQIAGMDDAAVAKMDDELSLGGRPARDEWVEQAQELVAGKPPRAKTDQKAAKADKE